MISFILNNQLVKTDKPNGGSLLDFIRYEMSLSGTKIGCREGDCGACTVMEGTFENGRMTYKSIVSCLTPLGNAHGKHIVTIEGLKMDCLSPIQSAFVSNAATQCGFCTPGFVMSLTSHSLSHEKSTKEKAIAAVSGNICRCTGYKSIERAVTHISNLLEDKNVVNPIDWLIENRYLPEYFSTIAQRLSAIEPNDTQFDSNPIIAGGTDLMVQKHDELVETSITLIQNRKDLKEIKVENEKCFIGSGVTASELLHSSVIKGIIPNIESFLKLVSSEPIRNMGSIGGNIVNASPIGDLSILLLSLNSDIHLNNRSLPLNKFFLGYKKLDLQKGEWVKGVSFDAISNDYFVNFEKVSKRTHLDIASVNSAISLELDGDTIKSCHLSAGGVSPVPLYLAKTREFLKGKTITTDLLIKGNEVLQSEISPIGDIRGSIDYKRLLIRQLFFAHFIKLNRGDIQLDNLL